MQLDHHTDCRAPPSVDLQISHRAKKHHKTHIFWKIDQKYGTKKGKFSAENQRVLFDPSGNAIQLS